MKPKTDELRDQIIEAVAQHAKEMAKCAMSGVVDRVEELMNHHVMWNRRVDDGFVWKGNQAPVNLSQCWVAVRDGITEALTESLAIEVMREMAAMAGEKIEAQQKGGAK